MSDEGQKLKLSEMLDYQKGSVVSRMIIKKPTGNITLFAFDKNEGLSEHTAPFDAMVQILEGKAEIKISSKKFILKSGETIILPAQKPHALKALVRFKMLLTMIKGNS